MTNIAKSQWSEIRNQKSESGVRSLTSDLCPLTSGFSLVEVTLAMMVMAIGILTIMSLFPAGLDQNLRSIADTHAAFFAEEVFGGLQATAETNWVNLEDFDVPVAASNLWGAPVPPNVTNTGMYVSTNKYTYNTYEDHAFRYRLVVTNDGASGLRKAATLFVWPGEFGSTNDPAVFYAEFFRWKP
jgi:Tfp pilus assembly protein PilV